MPLFKIPDYMPFIIRQAGNRLGKVLYRQFYGSFALIGSVRPSNATEALRYYGHSRSFSAADKAYLFIKQGKRLCFLIRYKGSIIKKRNRHELKFSSVYRQKNCILMNENSNATI